MSTRALSRGISFSKITTLDVSHNRFDDDGCLELLHSIRKTPQLEQLQIWGNKLGHETAKVTKTNVNTELEIKNIFELLDNQTDDYVDGVE